MTWNPLDPYLQTDPVERQKLAVFFCCVANKPAATVWNKVQRFLHPTLTPFAWLSNLVAHNDLDTCLQEFKLSPYSHVGPRLTGLVDAYNQSGEFWTWTDLVGKPYFGNKTPSCIGLYAFDADTAGLDVHVRRWLTTLVTTHKLFGSRTKTAVLTDRVLTAVFLKEARLRQCRPWELDRLVWMAGKYKTDVPDPLTSYNSRSWYRHEYLRILTP